MKKILTITAMALAGCFAANAQYDADTENGVVSLADHRGFTFTTKKGDFLFKPLPARAGVGKLQLLR